MTNEQRLLILNLIDYCDTNKFTLLNYHIGGGVPTIPDNASVVNEYGNYFSIEYISLINEWIKPQIKDNYRSSELSKAFENKGYPKSELYDVKRIDLLLNALECQEEIAENENR